MVSCKNNINTYYFHVLIFNLYTLQAQNQRTLLLYTLDRADMRILLSIMLVIVQIVDSKQFGLFDFQRTRHRLFEVFKNQIENQATLDSLSQPNVNQTIKNSKLQKNSSIFADIEGAEIKIEIVRENITKNGTEQKNSSKNSTTKTIDNRTLLLNQTKSQKNNTLLPNKTSVTNQTAPIRKSIPTNVTNNTILGGKNATNTSKPINNTTSISNATRINATNNATLSNKPTPVNATKNISKVSTNATNQTAAGKPPINSTNQTVAAANGTSPTKLVTNLTNQTAPQSSKSRPPSALAQKPKQNPINLSSLAIAQAKSSFPQSPAPPAQIATSMPTVFVTLKKPSQQFPESQSEVYAMKISPAAALCYEKCRKLGGISCKVWNDDSITCCQFVGCQMPFYCSRDRKIIVHGCKNRD